MSDPSRAGAGAHFGPSRSIRVCPCTPTDDTSQYLESKSVRSGASLRLFAVTSLSTAMLLAGCGGGGKGPNSGSTTGTGGGSPAVTPLAIATVAPTNVPVGSAAITLAVKGAGFSSSTVVLLNGTAEPTTFVNSTEVDAAVSAGQLSAGQVLTVSVVNGSSTVTADPSVAALSVDNPVPGITGVTPTAVPLGASAATISVAGTNFVPGVALSVNGSPRATTYVSATQLTAALTAADFTAAQVLPLNAINPKPGGGTSGTSSLSVNNPAPAIASFSPATLTAGSSATSVAINGSGFLTSTVLQINGVTRSATYVNANQVTLSLTANDLSTAGSLAFTLQNPQPGGGTSGVASFPIAAKPQPTPVVTSVLPTSFVAGSGDSYLNVYGTSLVSTSQVQWNGTTLKSGLATVNGGSSYLYAQVPASLLSTTGSASVTVSTPGAAAISKAFTVTITDPPAPTLSSVNPAAVPINTATTVTLGGTGFTSASTVSLNGVTIPSTYVNASTLTANISAANVALPGNQNITVTTPAPGGGTTAAFALTAYIGIANNSMIYNPVNGLFYASVPSSAGAPYGNSVVSVDPATGTLGKPIFVGSEPNKLAITSDGRYLWVGLDGAGAVRKVDLSNGVAGLQFALGGNGGIYDNPYQAAALAALPGATDSVVVSLNSGFGTALNIYDSGVPRTTPSNSYYNNPSALLVDGTRNEIYAGLQGSYYVYSYTPTALTLKTTVSTGTYASGTFDEMQIAGGRLYTDFGTVTDPESGSLLGTFYNTGTVAASGTTTADTSLAKAFVLDYSKGAAYSGTYNQIQIFNTADFTQFGTTVIPVTIASFSPNIGISAPTRLTRWGSNGLAFRTGGGVYSLRSNLVKDLSSISADLGVTLSSSGVTATGGTTTYTATVTNAGPSAASNVTLTPALPSTAVLASASTPCAAAAAQSCSLGSLASGASVSVTYTVTQNTAGTTLFTAQVAGSENDPVAGNNNASNSTTVTGSTVAQTPVILSLSPSTIQVGSSNTALTVVGANFTQGSTVQLDGTPLQTAFVSAGKLTATVPSAKLAALGWSAVTVSTPAPGGGLSAVSPLTVFQVLTIGVNHLLYDQFDRKLYASVGSGSSTVAGNSIAAITPETGAIGTPVGLGSQPTKMAMSDDGNILYTILGGAGSVARFNLLTQQADYSASLSNPNTIYAGSGSTGFRDLAVLPGSEDTIALDFGYTGGIALVDFTPSNQTAALRGGTGTGIYTGTSLQFLDAQTLLLFNADTWRTLDKYPITSSGFAYSPTHTVSTLYGFSAFKLRNKIAYANAGGVADPTPTVAVQLGRFPLVNSNANASGQIVEPDVSLSRVFFLTSASTSSYSGVPDSVVAYDQNTYLPLTTVPLPMSTIEGNTSFTGVDLVRWGQDGLAALTSGGHIYLLRGPVVVPQELETNTVASLTASSVSVIAHGAGNTTITLTGSNFVPGIAVTWNGSYRTTTIVDATHLTVAIPASDLANAGTGSLVATNPGASASVALTVTVQ